MENTKYGKFIATNQREKRIHLNVNDSVVPGKPEPVRVIGRPVLSK